jgi:hypothetical protein
MALSSISTLASASMFNKTIIDNSWGPYDFTFATTTNGLAGYVIDNDTFEYTLGTGATSFKNGVYELKASATYPGTTTPFYPYRMFDTSTTTRWFSGLPNQTNLLLDGTTLAYDQPAYIYTTGAYQGGRADGTATWSTNGYLGEFFQIKFPFNYVLTKIYITTTGGSEFSRGPKILHIFGSLDGTTWVLVSTITTTITNNLEYSYNVSNTTKYIYYRFVANTVVGGYTAGNNFSLASFRTDGTAWSL